jgi:TonB family protein
LFALTIRLLSFSPVDGDFMNARIAFTVLALAIGSQAYAADCVSLVSGFRVDFPERAQERRLHGTVLVAVRLNTEGQVTEAAIAQSSGHTTLDRAAAAIARANWRFNVATCAPADLSSERFVAITFKRPVGNTVSGTVNRRSRAVSRELLADRDCLATRSDHETVVFACRDVSARATLEAAR